MNGIEKQPVGFFDSGLGGLSVVSDVKKLLPGESIEYFADNQHQPYGEKSQSQIIKYSSKIMHFLLKKKIKACVIACNTATAASLDTLKENFNIPLIGVITPAVQDAIKNTLNKKIGIIATEFTSNSQIYQMKIKKIAPEINVFSNYCPECVALVENGKNNSPEAYEIIKKYLSPLKKAQIDTLIIGCTHYAFLKNIISKCMGEKVTLIDPAESTSRELKKLLIQKRILNKGKKIKENYYTSGVSDVVEKTARLILNKEEFIIQKIQQ